MRLKRSRPSARITFSLSRRRCLAGCRQPATRGPVARWQMLPRLALSKPELETAVETLLDYLGDKSSIVKTFAMQALADFAEKEVSLRDRVVKVLDKCTREGSPAMKSRGRKLLKRLKDGRGKG